MRPAAELIKAWTEALVPVCNHSRSHASQELKWLLQHAKLEAIKSTSTIASKPSFPTTQRPLNAQSSQKNATTGSNELSEQEVVLMQSYVDQRVKARKPLQYILGTQPFMDLEILTRPPTLIPRWETEEWTARLASILKNHPSLSRTKYPTPSRLRFNILDLCTGSGCISLGLASALPPQSCNVLGVDVDTRAVQLATESRDKNLELLQKNNVQFSLFDLWISNPTETLLQMLNQSTGLASGQDSRSNLLKERFDLVVSNPPYIARSEYVTLEPEVAQWEDTKALLAEEEGLVFYPRIANIAMEILSRNRDSMNSSSSSDAVSNASEPPLTSPTPQPSELEWISIRNTESDNDPEGDQAANGSSSSRDWRNGPVLDRVRIPELVLEIGGDHQVDFVSSAVTQAGFSRVEVWKDLADRARCIVGAR